MGGDSTWQLVDGQVKRGLKPESILILLRGAETAALARLHLRSLRARIMTPLRG